MKLLRSTKNKTAKNENGKNVFHLEITGVILVRCNIASNDYQQDSSVLYTINYLDNTPIKLSKFSTKNWLEINDDARETYNTKNQIKFKTSMMKLSLCDYSDSYILAIGTIRVPNTWTTAAPNNRKNVIVKNCFPFTACVKYNTNNITQIDNGKDIDVVMQMYNLIK